MATINNPILSAEDPLIDMTFITILDVNYLGRYASTTLAAFELFLS
ncbi:Uncharacterised protein [Klebsiella pneumoniae]|nr:Uncharacterised protein [Klebsiella pneumoniae]